MRVYHCTKCGDAIEHLIGRSPRLCLRCVKPCKRREREACMARYLERGGHQREAPGGAYRRSRYGTQTHRVKVESVLGKPLRRSAPVHHVDGNKQNNANQNLVACDSAAYHNLLHRRQRALDVCGHADWLKCRVCKQYDSPDNIRTYNSSKTGTHWSSYHLACMARAAREKKATAIGRRRIGEAA